MPRDRLGVIRVTLLGAPSKLLLRMWDLDRRLPKPLDDCVVEIAAHREGFFNIGDNAPELEFERISSESDQERSRRRRLHDLRMGAGDVHQDITDLNRIAVISDADLDDDAAQRIGTRPVLDDTGDEFGVRNDHARPVERLDLRCPHTNASHPSLFALDHDRVADADRPLRQQDEAGYEVLYDGLQPKSDTDRKGAGNQGDLLQIETDARERHHERRDCAEISEYCDDR